MTRKSRLRRAAVAAAFVLTAASAGAQTVDQTIDRAVAAWSAAKTLRGTFEQTLTNPLTGNAVTARGEFQQQGRKRIDIRFTDPAGDRVVADGRALWIYIPSTTPGQVLRASIAQSAGSVDLPAQFLSSPRVKYQISAAGSTTIGGRAARGLLLIPKRAGSQPFTRATVWVDDKDGLIRQFEVTDETGVTRRVRLTSVRANARVDSTAFRFTPPEGVRIVQQ
jgi:outer membrane lipoprotein carrier protein